MDELFSNFTSEVLSKQTKI